MWFWDGSCERGPCGAGIMLFKKVRTSAGSELLDADLDGRGTLMENLSRWIDIFLDAQEKL